MKSRITEPLQSVLTQNKSLQGQTTPSVLSKKPPIQSVDKTKSKQDDSEKQKLSNTFLKDNQLKKSQNEQSQSTHFISNQNQVMRTNQSQDKIKKVQRTESSLDGSKSTRSLTSGTTQLSMLKKSSASVYGSEAGIKPVTKNPWASTNNQSNDKKKINRIGSQANVKTNTLRSKSPQQDYSHFNAQKRSSISSTPLQQKQKTNQLDSGLQVAQQQGRKLVGQTINFGTFQAFTSKYQESQYCEKINSTGEQESLVVFEKIDHLQSQLLKNQSRKIQKEVDLLKIEYDLFLSNNTLEDKIQMTQRLNDFLHNADSLNSQYDALCQARKEQGNYVRINFEGRKVFLDIIKSQSFLNQISEFIERAKEINPNKSEDTSLLKQVKKHKAELCLQNNPENIFKVSNAIQFVDVLENTEDNIEVLIKNLQQQYKEVLDKQIIV